MKIVVPASARQDLFFEEKYVKLLTRRFKKDSEVSGYAE